MIQKLGVMPPAPKKARLRKYGAGALAIMLTAALLLPTQSVPAQAASTTTTLFAANAKPTTSPDRGSSSVELGLKFRSSVAAEVVGVRFYRAKGNNGTHIAHLWTSAGKKLATEKFPSSAGTGWKTAYFANPVPIAAGSTYVASYFAPKGHFSVTRNGFASPRVSGVLTALSGANGVYKYGASGFPTKSTKSSDYWVDVIVRHTVATDPTVSPSPTASASPTASVRPTATASPTATSSPTASVRPTATVSPTATASPTASVRPTPTASATLVPSAGGAQLNCVSVPSSCGYPDASNTGVPAGVSLRKVPQEVTSGPGWKWDSRGWLQVSANGAVVENLVVDGTIEVTGSNVTIRNNRILASGETWAVGLRKTVNATVSNNEIGVVGTPRLAVGIKDIYGDATGTRVTGNDISHTSTGVQTGEGLIEGNFIHDLAMVSGDHVNGTTSNGSSEPLTIRGNTVLNKFGQTDAISLFQDFGVEANRLVTGNLLAGGGYTIYGGMGSKGKSSNIKITNNRFSNIYFPNGGSYGPRSAYDPSGSGNAWSGNIWDHNGEPVE